MWRSQANPAKHRYHFKLYTLDSEMNIPEGASKEQVLSAIRGHVVAEAELVGERGR